MSYSIDLANSARRHMAAAQQLDEPTTRPPHTRKDVAGYLYGIAAECALKQIMRESGLRPLPPEQRRDDPYYAHFPTLKRMLQENIHGRRAGELRHFASDPTLMHEWDTDMRYAPGRDINPDWVDKWRDQARRLIDAMEDG